MNLLEFLAEQLAQLDRDHLRRELRRIDHVHGVRLRTGDQTLINFASNDYLGLTQHPRIVAAAREATDRLGAGTGASRLISGSLGPHQDLDQAIAAFKGEEAAVTFANGFAAALGAIPALVGPGDFVVLDRLAHACLVDGARLSGAKLRVFRHNDIHDLDRLLQWSGARRKSGSAAKTAHVLVITESVFSMDGDRAPLSEIVELTERHGAWLMVDEAHATGIMGPNRRGLAEELGLIRRISIPMGTLGKAIGVSGGFIAGPRTLCDFLIHRARTFVFSTAPPPGAAAAAIEALRLVGSAEGAALVELLWTRIRQMHRGLCDLGWPLPVPCSAILPLVVGPEEGTLSLGRALRSEGFLVPAIRYPSVGRGRARLRITVSAAHSAEDVASFLDGLRRAMAQSDVKGPAPNLAP